MGISNFKEILISKSDLRTKKLARKEKEHFCLKMKEMKL